MSATTGYPTAYNAVKGAYEDAVAKGLVVSRSNPSIRDIASAYGRLTMTWEQFPSECRAEFKRYDSHLRSVDKCLTAIASLRTPQADAARNALRTLRAAMQKAFFKMFDYDDNDYIDVNEMTRYLKHRFKRVYNADRSIEQQMGVTYQELAEWTAQQAFYEAQRNVDDSISLDEFSAWYDASDGDGAAVFLKAGGRFAQRPSWLEERLEMLGGNLESMDIDFRW